MPLQPVKTAWEMTLARKIVRFRVPIVLISILVTGWSLRTITNLRLNSSLIALLPENRPSVQSLHKVLAKTGGSGDLMVLIESPNPDESKSFARQLLPKIRSFSWVKDADIGQDTSFFEKNKLLYIDLEDLKTIAERIDARFKYEKLIRQPLYIDLGDAPPSLDFSDIEEKYADKNNRRRYFESEDGRNLILVIHPAGVTSNLGFVRDVYQQLSTLVQEQDRSMFSPAMQVSLGGTFRNRLVEYETIIQDVRSSALVVLVGLFLLLTWYFRHPMAIMVVGLPLAMGITWSFAIAYHVVGSLNMITVFLIVVLMGLGIDFGIHMFARFQRERQQDQPLLDTLAATLRKAGRPSLIAAMTTAASFLTLLVTEFRGFYDFGFVAGTGLIMSAVSYLIVFPALLVYVFRWKLLRPRISSANRLHKPPKHPLLVVGICLFITAAAIYLGRDVAFEYDLRNIRSQHPEVVAFKRKMRQVFTKARDPAAILVEDTQDAAQVSALLQQRSNHLAENSPIGSIWSIHNLLPETVDEKMAILTSIRKQVDEVIDLVDDKQKQELRNLRPKLDVKAIRDLGDLPPQFVEPFLGRTDTPGQLVFLFQKSSLLDLRNALSFSKALEDIRIGPRNYQAISEPLVYADMFRLVKHDTPIVLVLSALCVLLLLAADLRSITKIGIVLLPLVAGIIWMVGLMAIWPIKLNLLNATVLPVIFGLGIDSGVHIFHQAQELGWKRLSTVLRETGVAVAACTGTSMIGFGAMLWASHPGLRSIGQLAFVGLGACLVSALVFLPSVLALLRIQPKE